MLEKCDGRPAIDRDILKQAVIALDLANKHGDAHSRRQRLGKQLTAAIDIAR